MWRECDRLLSAMTRWGAVSQMVHTTNDSVVENKFWKELNHLLSKQYVTILYHLHSLTTVNYMPWFPWLHNVPLIPSVNIAFNYNLDAGLIVVPHIILAPMLS
jgi:hypothetical protein